MTDRITWTPELKARLVEMREKYNLSWKTICLQLRLPESRIRTLRQRYNLIVQSREWNGPNHGRLRK